MRKLFTLLFCFGAFLSNGGEFADRSFYLIDSLQWEKVSEQDRAMIDSVLELYHREQRDTAKVKLLDYIIESCWDDEIWPRYNHFLHEFVKQRLAAGDLTPAEAYFFKKALAASISNFGFINDNLGNIPQALENFRESIRLQEEIGDYRGVAISLTNTAVVYYRMGELDKALEYFIQCYEMLKKTKDPETLAATIHNIASIYHSQQAYSQALRYYEESITIKQQVNDNRGVAVSQNNMGLIYQDMGDSAKAMEYFKMSLAVREKIGEKKSIINSLITIGSLAMHMKDLAYAKRMVNRSIEMARKTKFPVWIQNASLLAYQVYKKEKNYRKSMEMYELYIQMRDSIVNEANQKAAIKQQMEYEFEKKEALLQAEKEKQELAHREKVKRQELIIWSVGSGMVIVIIFSIFLYNRFKVTQQQKNVIAGQKQMVDEKNKHITDSINYAQKIQEAILPAEEQFRKAFGPDKYFRIFQPKDIVSGDFCWLYQPNDDQVIWAAADCTGHGVPGAFMSMIGTSLLNEIVIEKGITATDDILNELRVGIKKAMGETDRAEGRKDGMDIALCSLDKRSNELTYAGAYNPLYLVRKGEPVEWNDASIPGPGVYKAKENGVCLHEFKANRQPIGSYLKETAFRRQTIRLQAGDMLYTFSDGYVDQFGGPKGSKFSVRRFRELLLSLYQQPLSGQKERLQQSFQEWKSHWEQIDDVTIIGVRV